MIQIGKKNKLVVSQSNRILPGTGGESVTYSSTARIVFVPPSMTKQTTGVLECVTIKLKIRRRKITTNRLDIINSGRACSISKMLDCNCHVITCWFTPLTWMQLQTRNVLFQLSSQYQFSTVFPLCAIIDQQKVCMPIV